MEVWRLILFGLWGFTVATAYSRGHVDAERGAQVSLDAAREHAENIASELRTVEAARMDAERERDELRELLDIEGDRSDSAGNLSLPADSVRRIDSIR